MILRTHFKITFRGILLYQDVDDYVELLVVRVRRMSVFGFL
jgi:hypothetical protein